MVDGNLALIVRELLLLLLLLLRFNQLLLLLRLVFGLLAFRRRRDHLQVPLVGAELEDGHNGGAGAVGRHQDRSDRVGI